MNTSGPKPALLTYFGRLNYTESNLETTIESKL